MSFFLGDKFNGSIFVDITGQHEVLKVTFKVVWDSKNNSHRLQSIEVAFRASIKKVISSSSSPSNYNRANGVAGWLAVFVCGNRLLEWLMSLSQKSEVMFASALP